MIPFLLSVTVLTCSDYDYLTRGLDRSDIPEQVKSDLRSELVNSTDPMCFDDMDAND